MRVRRLIGFVLLTGCATSLTPAASAIRDSDEKMVATCDYLGDVQGSSMIAQGMAQTGISNSKNEAREKSVPIGATHIVWVTQSSGCGGSNAVGRAYRCKPGAAPSTVSTAPLS
jgi:hypothetical protein